MTDKDTSHVGSSDHPEPGPYRVAILGTGKMGSAIAARLSAAGFQVVLWNRTRSRAEGLGFGTVADTPAAAAHDADIVISSLTGPEAVMAAYLGPDGALTAGKGKRFVEMSTAGPDLVLSLAQHIEAAGGTLVDAPIMGAPPVVRAGEATILVSGANDDVAAASPVLSLFGTVRQVGPLGSAARLKLVANSMLADVILAAAELQVAGEESGLDPDDVFWVLKRVAPSLEPRRPGIVEGRYEPPLFALRDLRKDVGLAAGHVRPIGRAHAAHAVGQHPGRRRSCRDPGPRYHLGGAAVPRGPVVAHHRHREDELGGRSSGTIGKRSSRPCSLSWCSNASSSRDGAPDRRRVGQSLSRRSVSRRQGGSRRPPM